MSKILRHPIASIPGVDRGLAEALYSTIMGNDTRTRLALASLFVFLVFAYAATMSTSTASRNAGEGFIRIDMLESFLKDGRLGLSDASKGWGPVGLGGKKYNWHEFGQNVFVLPLYLFMRGEPYAFYIVNMLATAMGAVMLAMILLILGLKLRPAVFTAAVYGTGTFAWHYASRVPHEHALGVMFMLGALLYAMRHARGFGVQNLVVCGLFLGFGFITRYDVILTVIPIFVYLYMKSKAMDGRGRYLVRSGIVILVLLAPFAAMNLYYNYVRFGEFFRTGRDWQTAEAVVFSLKYLPMGIAGAFLSPGKSLFLFALPLIPALFYYRAFYRLIGKAEAMLFGLCACIYSLFYCLNFSWDGEWGFGPRYFLPLAPLMIMPLSLMFERFGSYKKARKAAIAAIIFISIIVQMTFVSTNHELSNMMKYGISAHAERDFYRDHGKQGTWKWTGSFFTVKDSQFVNQVKIFWYTGLYVSGIYSDSDIAEAMTDRGTPFMIYLLTEFHRFDLWWVANPGAASGIIAALFCLFSASGAFWAIRLSREG